MDTARGPCGEVVIGLDEGLEFPCPECGTFIPAKATKCPVCRANVDYSTIEEESIDELHDEVSLLLKNDAKETEVEVKASVEETVEPSGKDSSMKYITYKRGTKVIFKKLKDRPT